MFMPDVYPTDVSVCFDTIWERNHLGYMQLTQPTTFPEMHFVLIEN